MQKGATGVRFVACAGSHVVTPAVRKRLGLVTEHLFRITVDLLHQGRKRGDIVCLPGRNHNADRQTLGTGAGVDFG